MARKLKIPISKKREKLNLFTFEDVENDIDYNIKSHIEIFSDKEITVECCQGILDYNNDYIKLRLSKGNVILFGKGLYISCFECNVIRIKGKLLSLEFCM